jgi:hypothetical protein
MANEFAVNQADLTSIANAIREKSGASGSLVFPDGFADAIAEIVGELPGNLTALASGSFTPSDNPKTYTIEHGMGVAPNFYMIRNTNQMGYNANANKILAMYATDFSNQSVSVMLYANSTTSTFTPRTSIGSTIGNATTITTPSMSGSYAFQSGHTYHWVCGVIETE